MYLFVVPPVIKDIEFSPLTIDTLYIILYYLIHILQNTGMYATDLNYYKETDLHEAYV